MSYMPSAEWKDNDYQALRDTAQKLTTGDFQGAHLIFLGGRFVPIASILQEVGHPHVTQLSIDAKTLPTDLATAKANIAKMAAIFKSITQSDDIANKGHLRVIIDGCPDLRACPEYGILRSMLESFYRSKTPPRVVQVDYVTLGGGSNFDFSKSMPLPDALAAKIRPEAARDLDFGAEDFGKQLLAEPLAMQSRQIIENVEPFLHGDSTLKARFGGLKNFDTQHDERSKRIGFLSKIVHAELIEEPLARMRAIDGIIAELKPAEVMQHLATLMDIYRETGPVLPRMQERSKFGKLFMNDKRLASEPAPAVQQTPEFMELRKKILDRIFAQTRNDLKSFDIPVYRKQLEQLVASAYFSGHPDHILLATAIMAKAGMEKLPADLITEKELNAGINRAQILSKSGALQVETPWDVLANIAAEFPSGMPKSLDDATWDKLQKNASADSVDVTKARQTIDIFAERTPQRLELILAKMSTQNEKAAHLLSLNPEILSKHPRHAIFKSDDALIGRFFKSDLNVFVDPLRSLQRHLNKMVDRNPDAEVLSPADAHKEFMHWPSYGKYQSNYDDYVELKRISAGKPPYGDLLWEIITRTNTLDRKSERDELLRALPFYLQHFTPAQQARVATELWNRGERRMDLLEVLAKSKESTLQGKAHPDEVAASKLFDGLKDVHPSDLGLQKLLDAGNPYFARPVYHDEGNVNQRDESTQRLHANQEFRSAVNELQPFEGHLRDLFRIVQRQGADCAALIADAMKSL